MRRHFCTLCLLLGCARPTPRPAAATRPPSTEKPRPIAAAPSVPRLPDGLGHTVSLAKDVLGLEVWLTDLVPPPADDPGTIVSPSEPAGGVRESIGGVSVKSTCDHQGCVDWLQDADGETLLAPKPRLPFETFPEDGTLESIIRITGVSEAYASFVAGSSAYSGGAHADNDLVCVTLDRSTRVPIALSTLLPEREVAMLVRRANGLLLLASRGRADARGFLLEDGDPHKIVLCGVMDGGGVVLIRAEALRDSAEAEAAAAARDAFLAR
ncbi:MAG: hypothetical protein K8W52_01115 [Deltaproteobacteria bacterium]|nr:hypothetical protein [Deltaproteobacteria bacterium]